MDVPLADPARQVPGLPFTMLGRARQAVEVQVPVTVQAPLVQLAKKKVSQNLRSSVPKEMEGNFFFCGKNSFVPKKCTNLSKFH